MLEERIINLEVKFTHQDEFLYELNKIVIAQQATIEKLQKDLQELKLVNAESDVSPNRSLRDDIPPHY